MKANSFWSGSTIGKSLIAGSTIISHASATIKTTTTTITTATISTTNNNKEEEQRLKWERIENQQQPIHIDSANKEKIKMTG